MKTTKPTFCTIFVLLTLCFFSCGKPQDKIRDSIDLSGRWTTSPDPDNEGISQNWSVKTFLEGIDLPGKRINSDVGPTWFSKKVSIPESWKDKSIQLILERSNYTMVWVDGHSAGESRLILAPQHYDLTRWLTPGDHTITLRIDKLQSAGYDDASATANTVMGELKLEAASSTHLSSMCVIPDLNAKKLRVKLRLTNPPQQGTINVKLSLQYVLGNLNVKAASTTYRVQSDSTITLQYDIKGRMPLWDEYKQPMLRMTAQISDEKNAWSDAQSTVFGLRKFEVKGTSYVVNNCLVFLRGSTVSRSFSKTALPKMDVESWLDQFKRLKDCGFNQCRFVSWCPPEAAFTAADKIGIYVQVDLPINTQPEEAKAVLSAYGNHPSFVLFSSGNMNWKQLSPNARLLTFPISTFSIRQYPFYSLKNSSKAADKEVLQASKKFANVCYRADIETALRTPGLSGYLVSGFSSSTEANPALWRSFNNDVVPLLAYDKYCWSQAETFGAVVEVANFSKQTLTSTVKWTLRRENGEAIKSGRVSRSLLKNGRVSNLGIIHFSLAEFDKPVKLNLSIIVDSTNYRNEYPLWVYPTATLTVPKSVMVSSLLNKAVMNQLAAGGKVLLLPTIRSIYSNSLPGSFFPDVPAVATSPGTLGLFIQSKHPLFANFPTESHSNWQWINIVNTSRALNLSLLDSTYTPIVRVIDNPKRNLQLGMICEFKVGAGSLLICTSKLFEIRDKPEAVQLYNSMLQYMQSGDFKPAYQLAPETLKRMVSYSVTTF